MRKHCEIDERITALAVHPDGTEVALCGDQGAVHVYPLPPLDGAAAPAADTTATSFRSAQARDGIVFAAYLAAEDGGRPALVTAAEADDAALCMRLWAVDRSQADAAQQVACKDSLRLTPGTAAAGGGRGRWAITAHTTQRVVMCGHEGAPGRVCTVAVGAAGTFVFYRPFLLGRDSSGVRALRIDGTSGADAGALHAIAVDGACFDRLSMPWAQVRPASAVGAAAPGADLGAPAPPAAAGPAGIAQTATASGHATGAPTAAAPDEEEDAQPRPAEPASHAQQPSAETAAAAVPDVPPPLPRVSSGASQRLLVPGALQRGGSMSGRGSVASDTHIATPPRASNASGELLVPTALSNASTPAASSVHSLSRPSATAVAATTQQQSGALPQGPQPSRSVGLDMLENLFSEPLPAAQSEAPPVPPAPAEAAASRAAPPVADTALVGNAGEDESAADGRETPGAVTALSQAAAAAATIAQRALGLGAGTPTQAGADGAAGDATPASGKKKSKAQKAKEKTRSGGAEALPANGTPEPGEAGASAAQLSALAESVDKLQKEVQTIKAASKANSEQVCHRSNHKSPPAGTAPFKTSV